MLTDAGPLVAIFDHNDAQHANCIAALQSVKQNPLITTWPCFTEAMYLLDNAGGYRFQERLWQMVRVRKLLLLDITAEEANRMDALMAKYTNVPMDLADASLVAVAESRTIRRIFTIDSDFYIYRFADNSMLEILR